MKKPTQFSTKVEFDATLDGRDVLIGFTRVTTVSHDPHYGADADGNRGMPMDFIDDDIAESITMDGTSITTLSEETRDRVETRVTQYLEETEPEWPDEPEPDYDDQDD